MPSTDEISCEKLEAMELSSLHNLKMKDYTRAQNRLINKEKERRKKEESATIDILMKMLEVLRPNEVAEYKARYQNQPPDPEPELGESRPPRANRPQNSGNSGDTPSGKAKEEPKSCYTFENYHEKVRERVKAVTFAEEIQTGVRHAQTFLAGSFRCPNPLCRQRWSSGIISTIVRGVHGPGNSIKYNALVYNQRCGACESLGIMKLKEDIYVERVVYRLKIWKKEFKPDKQFKRSIKSDHSQGFCEGCKVRSCPKAIYTQDRKTSMGSA